MEEKLRKLNDTYEIWDLECGGIIISVTRLNPFKNTLGHQHNYEEAYYICKGKGLIQIGGNQIEIEDGVFIRIPPNAFHKVSNPNSEKLEFVCAWRA